MAIHKINLKEMNFVSNANTEGTWQNAFICYGPGPKGIEHEGIKYTYGSQDKILFCNVCGQSWGWQERLFADLNKIDQIHDSKRGLFNNIKKQIDK
jgi:hypothetical protein|tara:strand:- start:407 stop:694 length:288 start_codon:yes stop_codon:yes gene_type:complete